MRRLASGLIVLALCGCRAGEPAAAGESPRAGAAGAAPVLRVVSYNIRHGAGMDRKIDLARIARVLAAARPDLVALQEVDRGCRRSGGVDQARVLAERLGMVARFAAFMPYQGGEYGLAVLSRHPIRAARIHRLPAGAEPRCALEVRVAPPGFPGPIAFVCVHADWTKPRHRLRQAKALARALAGAPLPVVLAGDFNAEPGDPSLRFLAGRGWRFVEKGGRATWPADAPRVEIDHFALSGPWRVLRAEVLPEARASDHRPIRALLAPGRPRAGATPGEAGGVAGRRYPERLRPPPPRSRRGGSVSEPKQERTR